MNKLTASILATSALIGAALVLANSALASGVPSAAAAPASTQAANTVDLQVALKASPAFPKATGSAQYQSQPGQREFQVEVEHLRSLAGRSVLVQVNGANVGRAKVSSTGIAQLTRNTELGQKVQSIGHGSTVAVKTAAGTRIASGTF
jgi:hypothetical protein